MSLQEPSSTIHVPTPLIVSNQGTTALSVARDFADLILAAGIPVFVCQPHAHSQGCKSDCKLEFNFPSAWQRKMADECDLSSFRPGVDALAMVAGHGIDVVDIDAKYGGHPSMLPPYERFGRVRTPSGGWHDYVPSTGFGKMSPFIVNGNLVGDYCGGTSEGQGRLLVFLPGSTRPKYSGGEYTIEEVLDLDGLMAATPDPGLLEVLSASSASQSRSPGIAAASRDESELFKAEHPGGTVSCPYGIAALHGLIDEAPDQGGRHAWMVHAVSRVVELMKAGCLDSSALLDIESTMIVIKPEGDDFESALSWAVSNVSATTSCDVHSGSGEERRFVDRQGVLIQDLADAILSTTVLRHDPGDRLWIYRDGVYRLDHEGFLRQRATQLLGNDFRTSHLTNLQQYVLGQSDLIKPEPQPDWINLSNGLLDWQTGQLWPHTPELTSTVQLPVQWDPTARCPRIDQWLSEVLPADLLEPSDTSPGFIFEVLGYLVLSGNPLHKAMLLLGSGRNGKGTFQRLLMALLGQRNVSAVDLHSLVENRFRAAELVGKIANIAGDIDGSHLKTTAMFKAITGGDTISAERKFGQPFDFTPFAVPVFGANNVFGTPDTSDGYLARWLVIPFPNSFIGNEKRNLDEHLSDPDELKGLLVKAIEGLRSLMARGNFLEPNSVKAAMDAFARESDPVRAFIDEVSEPSEGEFVPRKLLWEVYETWALDSGRNSKFTQQKLYRRVEATGWMPHRTSTERGFTGRKLTVELDCTSPRTRLIHLREGMGSMD
jgi:putative DNA primase/helicase